MNFLLSERALGDRTALVSAEGDTNAAAADRLGRHVTALVARGKAVVVVDLSGVTFVDSAVVQGLVAVVSAADKVDARLVVVEPVDPKVAQPLQIGGLDLAAVVVPTLDAAARAISLPGDMLRPAIPPAPTPPPSPNRPRRARFGRRELDQEILRELGQLRRSVQELRKEAGAHEAAADGDDDLAADLAQARAEAERMEEEAELAHARIQTLEGELELARSEIEMLREDVAAAHAEVQTSAAQASHTIGIADELERARAEADRMEDEAEQAHARIQALEGDLAAALESAESLRRQLDGGRKGGEEAATRVQTLEADLTRAQTEAESVRADLEPAAETAGPDLETPAAAPEPADTGPRPLVPVWADPRPINLNTAGLEELMLLPGIGRRPAERIIEHRTALGGLKAIEDLYAIAEIPNERIMRIRPYVRV